MKGEGGLEGERAKIFLYIENCSEISTFFMVAFSKEQSNFQLWSPMSHLLGLF